MENVGYAALQIIPSFKGFDSHLERGTSGPLSSVGTKGGAVFGNAAGKSAGAKFGSVFKSAAKGALLGLAGAGALAVKLGTDSISAASDLEESTNKVAQVFGKNADQIFKFTEAAGDALGQTNTEAREAAATFGIFGNAAGLSDRKSARFAKRMTTLASDLASFNNTEPDQAVQALGAALRGESEPIRAYGVMLDEATLKSEALALGLLKPVKNQAQIKSYQVAITAGQQAYNDAVKEHGKDSLEALKAEAALGTARDRLKKATEGTIPPLTQQQKLLAAQSQIFKQTEVAQGDFARTSDGLANQQRRLSARFENAKAELGQGLLPIMTDAADFLLDKGIPAFEDFAEWFTDKGIPKLKQFGGFVKDEIFPILEDVAGYAETAAGFVSDLVKGFNDLPSGGKAAALASLLGGGAFLKMRGGRGGALGAVGSAIGLAKPVPVFVTNGGFGAAATGTAAVAGAPQTRTRRTGKLGKGGKGSILALLGSLFGDDVLEEIKAQMAFPLSEESGVQKQAKFINLFGQTLFDPLEAKSFQSDFAKVINATKKAGVTASVELEERFNKLPKTIQTRFDLLGVPETERDLKRVLRAYDLTPKQKRTTLELLGYDVMLDRIARVNAELDWATRPREARIRITKAYADAGYETRGGLQQYGGTTSRRVAGGGLP